MRHSALCVRIVRAGLGRAAWSWAMDQQLPGMATTPPLGSLAQGTPEMQPLYEPGSCASLLLIPQAWHSQGLGSIKYSRTLNF